MQRPTTGLDAEGERLTTPSPYWDVFIGALSSGPGSYTKEELEDCKSRGSEQFQGNRYNKDDTFTTCVLRVIRK